jgi:flagellar M-ring protein FliF
MRETLDRVLSSGPGVWTGLGRGSQITLLVLGAVLPAFFFFGLPWLTESQYVPIFASLTTEDAGTVVAQLKASKTPYRVGGNGEQILVPADLVAELRLRLASQGLPLGGGVGFEVFDKTSFGLSDFAQRLNYQRALQGELARTIGQLRSVARARVHLVLPQPSVFTERERPASASVFLRLKSGGRPSAEEVRGIVHLVASSVEGLTPDRVTVVDTAGRVLSVGAESGPGQLSPRRLEIKAAVEEDLQRRVQTLLDAALGTGQAVTRIAAQLNLDQIERTEERFDPNSVVRQETRTVERSKGTSSSPSAVAALPPAPATPASGGQPAPATQSATTMPTATTSNDGSRESEEIKYEISKVVAHTLTSPGEIQRLSVGVLLNAGVKVTPAQDGKPETREPQPRTAEELEKIRKVVMGAVGYAPARGDEVTVIEMPFDTTALERERAALEGPPASAPFRDWITNQTVALAAVVLGALLAFLALTRQQSRRRGLAEVSRALGRDGVTIGDGTEAGAAAGGERSAMPLVPEELLRLSREQDDLRQQALALAGSEPQAVAQLLRAWMVKKKSLQPVGGGRDAS